MGRRQGTDRLRPGKLDFRGWPLKNNAQPKKGFRDGEVTRRYGCIFKEMDLLALERAKVGSLEVILAAAVIRVRDDCTLE